MRWIHKEKYSDLRVSMWRVMNMHKNGRSPGRKNRTAEAGLAWLPETKKGAHQISTGYTHFPPEIHQKLPGIPPDLTGIRTNFMVT